MGFIVALAGLVFSWVVGTLLLRPAPSVPVPPADIAYENVTFTSESGSTIKGWHFPGRTHYPTIVLMHGIRGKRSDMNRHAKFLHQAGYSVLAFDFQAHGQSTGRQITSGYLESMDAKAAVAFVRTRTNGKVGVLGSSLGGAAALLAGKELGADALVVEMVYPTLEEAVEDRIAIILGNWAKFLEPLLTWQMKARVGAGMNFFRVIDRVPENRLPKLFIAAEKDRHTTLEESKRLFSAAAAPKELWVVPGAQHEDLHAVGGFEYEQRVLRFFEVLRSSNKPLNKGSYSASDLRELALTQVREDPCMARRDSCQPVHF